MTRSHRVNRFYLIIVLLLVLVMAGLGYFAWKGSSQVSVLVEWTTASELDTAGFNLYRSLEPSGPFDKVNASLIATTGDPLTGGAYRYEDKTVQPGVVYYYQLEEVELDGGSERFGPISVQAKNGLPPWALVIGFALLLILAAAWLFRRGTNNPLRAAEEEH
jgi:hypothetical protein